MAKTIKVEALKARANAFLTCSQTPLTAERKAVHRFVSGLLLEAKAYKGFRYLAADERLNLPGPAGIVHNADGSHSYPDDTRTAFI